jgi:hypothetical protein
MRQAMLETATGLATECRRTRHRGLLARAANPSAKARLQRIENQEQFEFTATGINE